MGSISTTWTQRDTVAFTAGTLSDIDDCVAHIGKHLHRGTLSASSTPSETDVQNFLIRGKQKLAEKYGFTWKRKYAYAATAAGTWQYALPADFGGGGTMVRELTALDARLTYYDNASFDTAYSDPAGSANVAPKIYTIKDRELWLHAPANGTYVLELEYQRTGDDSTAADIAWLPESARFKICDYAIYRSFILLQNWNAAQMYKSEWAEDVFDAKHGNAQQKWAQMNYQARNWFYKK
jgi:hypothetical protein